MLTYPNFNPIAIQIGPIKIHWYGIMYLIGFVVGWLLISLRSRKRPDGLSNQQSLDLIFYAALGVVIGGRVGYMLFYNLPELISNPLSLFKIWDGGMSFHGGLLGVAVSMWLFSRKIKRNFFAVTDLIAPVVPIGLGAGRLGNFINGELWGKITHVPWAMVFPNAGPFPRHPSQLYEFALEGVALFIILWFYSAKPKPRMAVSGLFLLGYGCFRFFCEFFRQPDPQYGYFAWGWLTMGQILSTPMIIIGALMLIYAYKRSSDNLNKPSPNMSHQ